MEKSDTGNREQVMQHFTEPDVYIYVLWCEKDVAASAWRGIEIEIHLFRWSQSSCLVSIRV